jgi:lysozyme
MRTSAAGRKLIEAFEGLYLHAYDDGVGVLTIGYGHTSEAGPPRVTSGMTISRAEAERILAADLARVEAEVARLVMVPLNQNQFDALVSFQFNTGGLARSTLLKLINLGLLGEAPRELMKWNIAGGRPLAGLTRRRKAEAALWLNPVIAGATAVGDAAPPAPPEAPVSQPPDIEPDHPLPPFAASGWLVFIRRLSSFFRSL